MKISYEVYMLQPEHIYRRFMSFDALLEKKLKVAYDIYEKVYSGELETARGQNWEDPEAWKEACEDIYWTLNKDNLRPRDYFCRSLSVSDVLIITVPSESGELRQAWYCDSVGFEPLAMFGGRKG